MPEPSAADKTLIEEMLANTQLSEKDSHATRLLAKDDLKFLAAFDKNGISTQWSAADLKQYKDDGIPAMTVDHISQFPNQVKNELRQMRMAIQVNPVDHGADPPTAEVLQGIMRSIEQNSHAPVAHETAQGFAVDGGFGFSRVITKYTYDNPKTEAEFNAQHIEIKPVKNPFTVFGDPAGNEPDGSDWEFCTIIDNMLDTVYRRKYGDSYMSGVGDWGPLAAGLPEGWLSERSVRVAEYFYSKHKNEKAVLLSDGAVVFQSILDANVKKYGNAGLVPDVRVVGDRMIDTRTLHWIKANAKEVLERRDWPGKYIPVIPIYGSESNVDGERILSGMIRNSKDAQRGLNYLFSLAATLIGMMPKAPYIGTPEQFAGHERLWAVANKRSFAFLPINAVIKEGFLLPLPQRNSFEPAIMAIISLINHLQYTMKATQGMYGSALGEPSGEKSGLAIQTREAQGNTATFHYKSNAERYMWHLARVTLDLIPHVYDDQTVLEISGKDDKKQTVMIDSGITPEQKEAAAQEEIPRFNIAAGRYDITISIGQAYATQRQESVVKVSEVLKTWGPAMPPQAMQVMLLELLRNLDIPGGKEMAEKVERILGSMQPGQAIPPEVQKQLQGMGQQIKLLADELGEAKARETAKTSELQSRENIERMRGDTTKSIAAINAQVKLYEIKAEAAGTLGELESAEAMTLLEIEELRRPNPPIEREPAPVAGTI